MAQALVLFHRESPFSWQRSEIHADRRKGQTLVSPPAEPGAYLYELPALVFNGRMNMPTIQPLSYSGYRFPAVIISHCTWLYFRFALSYRDVAEMMAEHGVTVSYESIREWRFTAT